MGIEIDRESFTEGERAAFVARLRESLEVLEAVLSRPGFGEGPRSIGAELELDLIDGEGSPARVNHEVLAALGNPSVCLELNRYNLEVNSSPVALAGAPFGRVGAELESTLADIQRVAAGLGARPITVGILPTLTERDLGGSVLSDRVRYRALARSIRELRHSSLPLRIQGADPLEVDCDDVAAEGANTSFQVHLRVSPSEFAMAHAAAQMATAPVLALAGNSPLFLGHRLWEETRIALFRQATDDRADAQTDDHRPARVSFGHGWVREGIHELFAESVALHPPLLPVLSGEPPARALAAGRAPRLAELRLHHGTVWRWNRAVYDDADGGHVRIEFRALPSGPTVVDMMANAAFLVGLTLALMPTMRETLPGFPFGQARRNFYMAAEKGLSGELLWPRAPGAPAEPLRAAALVPRLLPVAEEALTKAGVSSGDTGPLFALLAERAASGQTGAVWQRRVFEAALPRVGAGEAARELVQRYAALSEAGAPVHTWSVGS